MRDLLALEDLSREQLISLLDRAQQFTDGAESAALRGRRVAMMMMEPSTRTKLSFQIAIRSLGGEVLDLAPDASSMKKGESVGDTVRTLRALGTSVYVVRHAENGFPGRVAEVSGGGVVSAGDGTREHPTQGLLDLLTMRQEFGRLEGLHVAIVGDVAHSRVAGSQIAAHARLGNRVTPVGPPAWAPRQDFDAVLAEADVVMMLRIQRERMGAGEAPPVEEYHRRFGMTVERLSRMRDGAIVMHPGPMNAGVEITEEAAAHPRSRIWRQVANGIPARQAALEWIVG